MTTITTAPYFPPGEPVALAEAVEESVAADAAGRITFRVDLGPPHEVTQFTPEQAAREALEGEAYWTTRNVSFRTDD
ncbi:MAG: hypothetical protein ACREQ9_23005 [Candidatus Binatia bacterium]